MPEEKIEELKEEVETETAEVETETVEVEEVEAETVKAEEVATEEIATETAKTEVEAETEAETAETPEATEATGDRTLAETIEIAEKSAASAVPKKKYNKKGIIAVTVLVIVFALMLSIAGVNTFSMSDEEYYELYEASSMEIVEDAYNAVIILSSRMSYYSENEYIDAYYADILVELEASVSVTDEMMKELSNPPSTYKEHYELLDDFYDSYMECLDLVLDYGDDETAYVETATVAIEEFIEYYSALYDIVMADYIA